MSDSLRTQLRTVADGYCQRTANLGLDGWPAGAAGLRKLADALDDACERLDDGQEDEDRLVEGSGALLAHLLLDALAAEPLQGQGRLMLRVGVYGCFDPFDAARHAIEAELPSEALRTEVARAEAEASGTGPHARVVRELVQQVQAVTPFEFRCADHEHVAFSDSLEIALTPLLRVCAGESEQDVKAAVSRVVRSIPQATREETDWDLLSESLFPRLVNQTFVEQMKARELIFEPFDWGLAMAFVVRDRKMVRYLRASEVPDAFSQRLRERAVENLERRSARVRVRHYAVDPRAMGRPCEGVFQLTYGDGFDASRLCLPALGAALVQRFGSGARVSVPHRDALLAARQADGRSLMHACAEAFERAPHALSRQQLRVNPEGGLELADV